MTCEIWKPVKGFEGYYEVSNLGRVKSLSRKVEGVRYGKHYEFIIKERIVKLGVDNKGYFRYPFSKNGVTTTKKIHRVVAEAFLGDIYDKEVDHINTIRTDNRVENLRIVTSKENCNNPLTKVKNAIGHFKPVRCIKQDGTVVEFSSITEAENNGYGKGCSISQCCNGKLRTYHQCRWEYIN